MPDGLNPAKVLDNALAYWRAGGNLMWALAAVTFLILLNYLLLLGRLREANATPSDFWEHLPGDLPPSGSGVDTPSTGALSRILRHLDVRTRAGLAPVEAFQQCREAETEPFTHAFYVLGALVAVAPLLGLLGTLLGMIATFTHLGQGGPISIDGLADGISEALITTQVGLLAALPGAFGLAHLYRLYQRLNRQLDRCESWLRLHRHDPGALPS